jgi:DNA (cytosine-5)-methyltransferase 1
MYRILHNEKEVHGDIMKIDAADVPNHEVLVGGFPCQGFSINGTRLGFEYKTGNLFFEALRIAKEKKPKYVLMENVPGLLNHDKRRTISIMAKSLSDAGYCVDFTILTSTDFGLPQKRSRVFIVGVLDGVCNDWTITGVKQIDTTKKAIKENFRDVKTFNFPFPLGVDRCTSLESVIEKDIENIEYIEFGDFLIHLGDGTYRIKDGTIQGYTDFRPIPNETTIDYTFTTSKTRRGRIKNGMTKTLDQSVDIALYDGIGFRRISPKEVFRLQGFPDDAYTTLRDAGFKEIELYRRPSRSVSIPIIKALGKAIQQLDAANQTVSCTNCRYWSEFDDNIGICENTRTIEEMTYAVDGCSLGRF